MAVSADCRISLSAPSCLRGSSGLTRHIKLGKFCNGELMGKKLNLSQLRSSSTNSSKKKIQMSLTSVTGETKVQEIESEKRDPRTVASIILGGGAGTRLFPLTKRRAKPAVPIGGAYRLIDVPMSNCINSGINKVYILTQYNSASLNRHLARAYNSNGVFGDGFVEALAATQTPGETGKRWFQGTADAVRQFHWLFEDARSKEIEDVLILSGDHLYRMDYMDFVQDHRQSGADISISCIPIDDRRASDFGLMKIDEKGRVISFSEKPKGDDLKAMAVDTTILGLSKEEAEKKPYIASMGVYVFKKEILLNLLRWRFPTANDFGSEIIPFSAKEFYVNAYLFNDYWEDIGTIRSFFEANLALTEHPPAFSFYDAAKPIYTSRRNLPPSKIDGSKLIDSIISHGSFLTNCLVEHSIVGIRSRIGSNVQLKDTVMLGADFYETEAEVASLLAEGKVPIGIGENTKIKECIIDKNARAGNSIDLDISLFFSFPKMALQVALLVSSAFSVQKDGKVNASSSSFKDSSLFGASITEHGSSSLRFKREHSSRSVLAVRAQTAATSSPSVTKSSSGGKKTLRKGNVVVTGASSGLGLATAKALAETGKWHVIMACRDFLKAERAAKSAGMPKDSYTVMHLDLASLDSVRQFVDSFRRSEMPLDVLVCNAAVYFPTAKEPSYSAEGFELSVATNHLGHFLLSRLLLDDLKKSDYPSKRLIIVGSITGNTNTLAGNVPPKANLGDLRGLSGGLNGLNSSAMIDGGDFDGAKAYKDSKVCNMLTMQELHRRYHEETGVTFASLYPGCIASTGLFREHIPLFRTLFPPFQKYITKGYVSETESGKRLAQVVSDPSLTKSGVYWSWNKASASFENELSEEASDVEKARKVWEISEKLVGLA